MQPTLDKVEKFVEANTGEKLYWSLYRGQYSETDRSKSRNRLESSKEVENTEDATDLLITAAGAEAFTAPRLLTNNTHGTGCTLASAIAAGLAKQLSLSNSVKQAKDYLHNALLYSEKLHIGQGSGPVHHFYSFY